jgi:RNAse (barnase) inhibitor barstar
MKPSYLLDGADFHTLEELAAEFSERMLVDWKWNRNLNAFNDILRGGFGTPENGFIWCWKNSQLSRVRLGEKLFDTLVEIIRDHGEGGTQADDKVELELL